MELINNASLKPFVTFGVEATCDHLYKIEEIEELKLAVQYLENPLIFGGGSNVLPIGDIKRNVLKVELKGIDIEEQSITGAILDAAQAIAKATAILMHAATGVQQVTLFLSLTLVAVFECK